MPSSVIESLCEDEGGQVKFAVPAVGAYEIAIIKIK
jgi:hypothetical protein